MSKAYLSFKRLYSGRFGQFIDGEDCVRRWFTLGSSLRKVANDYNAMGICNPVTNKPVTADAVAKAAWRWIFDNPIDAKEKYIKPLFSQLGEQFSEDDFWANYVAHTFSYIHGRKRRMDLWQKYGLNDIAKEMEARREKFGTRYRRLSGTL